MVLQGEKNVYSFVVPVYNVKVEYLRQSVDSILSNKQKDLEVLLIDDCSTNGCAVVCDELAEVDPRVKVIHRDRNRGVSSARNTGIAECRGEWIVFVDSDDWIDPDSCDVLDSVTDDGVDVIAFSAYRESASGTVMFGTSDKCITYRKETNGDPNGDASLEELSDRMLKQVLKDSDPKYETIKYCWGKAFNRSFLQGMKLTFAELSYCEDIVFMAAVLEAARTVIQIPNRLYHYRTSATSTVNSYRENAVEEQKTFLQELRACLGEKNQNSIYYAALLSMQICITRYFYNKNRKAGFFRRHSETRKAFSAWPYCDVFKHVKCGEMKRSEMWKARLIKWRLYYLYYLGTEARRKKTKRFE